MQPLIHISKRNRCIRISCDWNFPICKGQQNKIAVGYTWPSVLSSAQAPTTVTLGSQLSPTIELVLAIWCVPVVSLWIHSDKIVERSLQKQSITSPPLVERIAKFLWTMLSTYWVNWATRILEMIVQYMVYQKRGKILKENLNISFCAFFPCCRSEGKRFGFAESLPTKKITVNRQDMQEIDTSDAMETAQEIVEQAEPPPKMYPIYYMFHSRYRGTALHITFLSDIE